MKYLDKDTDLMHKDANLVDGKYIPKECDIGWRKIG
jgi:hypothetical protein